MKLFGSSTKRTAPIRIKTCRIFDSSRHTPSNGSITISCPASMPQKLPLAPPPRPRPTYCTRPQKPLFTVFKGLGPFLFALAHSAWPPHGHFQPPDGCQMRPSYPPPVLFITVSRFLHRPPFDALSVFFCRSYQIFFRRK